MIPTECWGNVTSFTFKHIIVISSDDFCGSHFPHDSQSGHSNSISEISVSVITLSFQFLRGLITGHYHCQGPNYPAADSQQFSFHLQSRLLEPLLPSVPSAEGSWCQAAPSHWMFIFWVSRAFFFMDPLPLISIPFRLRYIYIWKVHLIKHLSN